MILVVLFLSLLIISLTALWFYQNFSHFYQCINKIPGPARVPFLGNFFEFAVPLETMFRDDRERSSKYYPIYRQSILNVAAVSILKPEDIEIVLSSTLNIKKSQVYDLLHPWLGTGLLTSHGEKWKQRRKLLTPAFHFGVLQDFVQAFNDATSNFLRNLETKLHQPHIDVIPEITELTLESIAETSMGTKLNFENDDNKNYKTALHDFVEIVTYRMVRPWWYTEGAFKFSLKSFKLPKLVKTLHNFTQNIIEERKRNFAADQTKHKKLAMLDLLLKVQNENGSISDHGIREEVDTFVFEGHDTTAGAIMMTLLVLANHQKEQEEMRREIIEILGLDESPTYSQLQELNYTERCIKECLRLYPSVPFIARDALEDIQTTTGYTIPKGAMIHLHIYDIHRNPKIFPDPEKFDPDRFLPENTKNRHPFAYIPFSAGPRNCIGQKYATLEIKAVLCGVLRKFYLEPVDKMSDIVFRTDLVLRSCKEIRIKFVKRSL